MLNSVCNINLQIYVRILDLQVLSGGRVGRNVCLGWENWKSWEMEEVKERGGWLAGYISWVLICVGENVSFFPLRMSTYTYINREKENTHIQTRVRAHTHTCVERKIWLGWVWFYGISTIAGYSMPKPLYTYILNIYDLVWLDFMIYQTL